MILSTVTSVNRKLQDLFGVQSVYVCGLASSELLVINGPYVTCVTDNDRRNV